MDRMTSDPHGVLQFFVDGVRNAIKFGVENRTIKGKTISKDCFEATISTPLDKTYMLIKRVVDNPSPNYFAIINPTDEEKDECMRVQKVFRIWWRETLDYAIAHKDVPLTVISFSDDELEFKVATKDDGILHIKFKREEVKSG
jgi:hypothetical protein